MLTISQTYSEIVQRAKRFCQENKKSNVKYDYKVPKYIPENDIISITVQVSTIMDVLTIHNLSHYKHIKVRSSILTEVHTNIELLVFTEIPDNIQLKSRQIN